MRKLLILFLLFIFICDVVWCATKVIDGHEVESINHDWKFSLQDDSRAYGLNYDDSKWCILSLPHDWAFENGYSKDGVQADYGGYTDGGIGWYRKELDLSEKQCKNKRLFIHFDAVYRNSEVWINGHYLGKRPYGYISFEYEVTKYVKPGKNLISVRVDNSLEPSARWYHGCGIYGNVSLIVTSPIRFTLWDTFITAFPATNNKADIGVKGSLDALNFSKFPVEVEFEIVSPDKQKLVLDRIKYSQSDTAFTWKTAIRNPLMWDLKTPHLYTIVMRIWKGKQLLDEKKERFGIRSIEWKANTGFWLNSHNVKLQGVCEHLEGGPVGAAWTENLMRWKIKMLKDMGCNAIRTAHNPQLPMFYNICDEMGMLVMDEAFDGWKRKAPEDYGKQAFTEWWERDLRDMIRRDRNHPCVIIHSIGNETGGTVAEEMVRVCHKEDPTRLVTSGHSSSELMDVLGVNGASEKKSFIQNYIPKDKAFVGTETPHTWQVRGYYRTKTWYRDGYPNSKQDPFETPDLTVDELFGYEWTSPDKWANVKQHFNSSYDNGVVRINARQNIEFLRDLPWYSGSFRWTGFDYLGEAGYVHGGWPFRAFMGGVLDLAGFKKDHYFLYQAEWTERPMVHILPHWTHPDMKIGTKIPVWVYTTGDQVELFLNGHSLGKKKKGAAWNEMQCEWMVPWTSGSLEAVAYKDGLEITRTRQTTSGVPDRLCAKADTASLTGSIDDLHILSISLQDKKEVMYPYGENRVYFHVDGPGEIFSTENGNPVDVESNYRVSSKKAFFGLLRIFIKRLKDEQVRLYVASIIGDKRLKLGKEVSIDIIGTDVYGTRFKPACEVYYTVDGTEPSRNSLKYKDPFKLKEGAIVKALVVCQGRELFRMAEVFGQNEGIYWGKAGSNMLKQAEIQAESCKYLGAVVKKTITSFHGKGYVQLNEKGSGLEFYQENDGSERTANMCFSSTVSIVGNVTLKVLNNGKQVAEKNVVFTSEQVGKWQRINVSVPMYSGANQFKIEIIQGEDVCIDWIEIK